MVGVITVSGTTMTITGGTSLAPVTLADIVAQAPSNINQSGQYYEFIGINLIQIGDGGVTPTYVNWTNAIISSQNQIELKCLGINTGDYSTQNTEFVMGSFDQIKLIGINGCKTKNIILIGYAGKYTLYDSDIDYYIGVYWFGYLYAYDCVFGHLSDRLGKANTILRCVIKSSDGHYYNNPNQINTAMVPSINVDTLSKANTRYIKKSDVVSVVNIQDFTTINLIFEDKNQTIINWTYNNAGFINYGRLKTTPVQNSGYNDSVFSNYQSFTLQLSDPFGNPIEIQSVKITDSQTTPVVYAGLGTPSEFLMGLAHFDNILLEKWVDRPGGQVGVTDYTDCAPFTLDITDVNGILYSQVINIDDYISPNQIIRVIVPSVQVAPSISGIVLAETYMVSNKSHDVYYKDITGLQPLLELIDSSGTVYVSSIMNEISSGIYQYTLPVINTIPNITIPGYYLIRVTNGNKIDVASIEFTDYGPLKSNDVRLNNLDATISSRASQDNLDKHDKKMTSFKFI